MREKVKAGLVRAGYMMGGLFVPYILGDMPVNPQEEPWARIFVLVGWLFCIYLMDAHMISILVDSPWERK